MLARGGGLGQANTVAYGSIVATQLAQTLEAGWTQGRLDRSVLAAVAGSAGVLVSTLTIRPVREVLQLALPTPFAWALIGTGALSAVALSRALALLEGPPPTHADKGEERGQRLEEAARLAKIGVLD